MAITNSSGFKYRMDSIGVDSSSLLAAYDFVSGSSFSQGYLDKPIWLTGSTFSGKINGSPTDLYKKPGSGFLNGTTSVSVGGLIPSDDFTFLFCYERARGITEVLLSSALGTNFSTYSGLTVGVNDINKLYLEYWNPVEGRCSLDYEKNIASKNLVYFNRSFGEFKLGVFDPVGGTLDYSTCSAVTSQYSHSNNFKLGQSSSTWSSGLNFSGYFDDFYCLSGKIPDSSALSLFSGFYSIPMTGGISGDITVCKNVTVLSGSGVVLGTGITGYKSVPVYTTGYVPTGCFNSGYSYLAGTGITGYENKYIGMQPDNCGFFNPVYILTPLTGAIYNTGFTYACSGSGEVITTTYTNEALTGTLTGLIYVPVNSGICSTGTGYYPDSLYIDSGFISSLGFERVYSFHDCQNIFQSECYFYTGATSNSINLKPEFNSVSNEWAVSSEHSGSGKNLIFNNGQLLLESGWSSYTSGYSTLYNITGNIFLDGNIIRSNGYADEYDSLVYDNSNSISGNFVFLQNSSPAGTSLSSVFSSTYSNYSIFLNGIKLFSGLDYSSSQFLFDIPASSVLIKINNNYISSNKIYVTGLTNELSLNGLGVFSNNSSQFYINGIRQELDNDYVEVSRFSVLTGCPVLSSSDNQLVYSFSSDFWNI